MQIVLQLAPEHVSPDWHSLLAEQLNWQTLSLQAKSVPMVTQLDATLQLFLQLPL